MLGEITWRRRKNNGHVRDVGDRSIL